MRKKNKLVKALLEMLCLFPMMHLGLISSKRKAFAPVNCPLVNLPWTFFFAARGIRVNLSHLPSAHA